MGRIDLPLSQILRDDSTLIASPDFEKYRGNLGLKFFKYGFGVKACPKMFFRRFHPRCFLELFKALITIPREIMGKSLSSSGCSVESRSGR
jgi:hypothetical protein